MRRWAPAAMAVLSLWACQKPVDARLSAGDAAARAGRWADARAEFAAAVAADPASPRAHARLGFADWQLGDHPSAAASWEAAGRLAPDDPESRAGLGLVALEAADAGAALELLAGGTSPLARLARARALLLRGAAGDAQAALDEAQALLAGAPDAPDAAYLAGCAQIALRRFGDAQGTLERLQARHPASPLGPYGLARLAAAQQRPTDTLLHLAAARDAAPAGWKPEVVAADPAFAFLSANADFKLLVGK